MKGFLEKYLKNKFALKSDGESLYGLEKSLNFTIFSKTLTNKWRPKSTLNIFHKFLDLEKSLNFTIFCKTLPCYWRPKSILNIFHNFLGLEKSLNFIIFSKTTQSMETKISINYFS